MIFRSPNPSLKDEHRGVVKDDEATFYQKQKSTVSDYLEAEISTG